MMEGRTGIWFFIHLFVCVIISQHIYQDWRGYSFYLLSVDLHRCVHGLLSWEDLVALTRTSLLINCQIGTKCWVTLDNLTGSLKIFKVIIFFPSQLLEFALEVIHILALQSGIFIEHVSHSFHSCHLETSGTSEWLLPLITGTMVSDNHRFNLAVEHKDLFASPSELPVNMLDLLDQVMGTFGSLHLVAVGRHFQLYNFQVQSQKIVLVWDQISEWLKCYWCASYTGQLDPSIAGCFIFKLDTEVNQGLSVRSSWSSTIQQCSSQQLTWNSMQLTCVPMTKEYIE